VTSLLVDLKDKAVEGIVRTLEEEDLLEDSIIVYASDNGGCYRSGGQNAPLRGTKHYLFEGKAGGAWLLLAGGPSGRLVLPGRRCSCPGLLVELAVAR
jgi:hypothetical protein